jgi:heterotetrameric sarcosine oxidase gamma subunit
MHTSIPRENVNVSDLAAATPPPLARTALSFPGPRRTHDGWEVTARHATGDLRLADLGPLVKLTVRGPADGAVRAALGPAFGRTVRPAGGPLADTLVVGSGPGEWLVLGAPGRSGELLAATRAIVAGSGEFASVVDVTHGRALVRLTGAAASATLAKVCAIDLSDRVVPDGSAFRSSVARVVTDVVRDDVEGTRSYLLHCERSSGQYLADSLLDAGVEHGIEVDSPVAAAI